MPKMAQHEHLEKQIEYDRKLHEKQIEYDRKLHENLENKSNMPENAMQIVKKLI